MLGAPHCAPWHTLGTPQRPSFPTSNSHRARVRRNRKRLPSNGFIERAKNPTPTFTARLKRASDKPLTFLVQLRLFVWHENPVLVYSRVCAHHDIEQLSSRSHGQKRPSYVRTSLLPTHDQVSKIKFNSGCV
jgi:hypothetical protein